MKLLFLFLLILLFVSLGAQNKINISNLIEETIQLMKSLNIEVRDSLKRDGVLKIMTIDTIKTPAYKNIAGTFNRSSAGRTLDVNGKAVKYATPIIYIEHFIDSVLREQKDTSRFIEAYAKSQIVHELVHFLQKTVYLTYSSRQISLDEYFKLPDENEALSVEALFFLKHYAPKILDNLPKIDKKSQEYRINLVNALLPILNQKSIELKRQL